ncbi:hypothetical protein PFISCL1PPCAC_25684, partial [Pristionchus fissidentatus]
IVYREKIFPVFRQILDTSDDEVAIQSLSLYSDEVLKGFETKTIDNLSICLRGEALHPHPISESADLAERGHPWWRSNIVPEYKLDE